MMTIIKYILLSLIILTQKVAGQEKKNFTLGEGVVIIKYEPWKSNSGNQLILYKDRDCTLPFVTLTLENTDCPKCMECAEPTDYHKGILHPFICNAEEGMVFVGNKNENGKYEIFTDTTGHLSYLSNLTTVKFYSWSEYMMMRSKKGDYFSFDRSWNHNIIYDKKYNINKLPKANSHFFVGAKINQIEDVKFYPVEIDGRWMKIKGVRHNKIIGYYWIIWRNEKEWLVGFTFDPN